MKTLACVIIFELPKTTANLIFKTSFNNNNCLELSTVINVII